jgi:leucine dehydrogenase
MTSFDAERFADHEEVVFCHDREAGLHAIIAIHDTSRGPAVGGCRMWPYATLDDALRDALRLSRAMSCKSALAGLPFGGGKAVILGDPARDKTPELLQAFGRFVDGLGGRYVAAEDAGIGVRDVEVMAQRTPHVAGLSSGAAASGDPSPLTARGVHAGMRAAVAHRLGRRGLSGLRVAVQGVGSVGMQLCERLHAEGARLVVADVDPHAVRRAVERFGARAVEPEEIVGADVDVFAPCALSRVIDDVAVQRLRARVVAGAANDQIAEPRHGDALARRGVLYAPDYVINAGGIVNILGELSGRYDRSAARAQVDAIGERLLSILRESDATGSTPGRVADARAHAILEAARAARARRCDPALGRGLPFRAQGVSGSKHAEGVGLEV